MATFLQLQTQIAADIGTNSQNLLDDEIKEAIIRAIEDFENERFKFNEGRTTFPTVALQAEYDLNVLAPDVLTFDEIQYLFAGHLYRLERQSYEWLVEALVNQTAQTGPSNYYAVYNEKLFLYPQPDVVTSVTISGVHRQQPSPLAADGDTNDWTTIALQMVRARAKADLYLNRLKQLDLAKIHNEVANDYLIKLRSDRDRFTMSDTTKPFTTF